MLIIVLHVYFCIGIVYILSSCIFKFIQSSLYAYIIYIRFIKLGDSKKIHIHPKHR